MSAGKVIPRTCIQGYYKAVSKLSLAERVREAEWLLEEPTRLVTKFECSVKTFAEYDNATQGFYSNKSRRPPKPKKLEEIASGVEL